MKLRGTQDRVAEPNERAVKLAQQAADAHLKSTGIEVILAGSMGPTGELFEQFGALRHKSADAAFGGQAMTLDEGSVDLLWIETISSNEEVAAAIELAKYWSVDLQYHDI